MQMSEDRRKAKAEEQAAAAKGQAEQGGGAAGGAESGGSERRLAIRTRFCDDFFEDCAGRRGIKQVGTLFFFRCRLAIPPLQGLARGACQIPRLRVKRRAEQDILGTS